jgi:hypothetical protein
MRILVPFLLATIACASCAAAEDTADAKSPDAEQIAQAVEGFFAATGDRDVIRLRDVVDQSLLIVEAGSKPDVHLFHSPNVTHLLPPHGNDDVKSLKIDRVAANVSATNPTVAMASFRVALPISESQQKELRAMLEAPNQLTSEAKSQIQGALDGMEMFAMLVRKDGKWKLVALTVPK